jgi:CopG family nickel-responsive transcriptional regulator
MPSLTRFGVSIDSDLLKKFDQLIARAEYSNRSEAFRDLIRARLTEERIADPETRALGVFTMVYDHHSRTVANRLADIQQGHHHHIISTLHVHLDQHSCLKVILLKGTVRQIRALATNLMHVKGVLYHHLSVTAAGAAS